MPTRKRLVATRRRLVDSDPAAHEKGRNCPVAVEQQRVRVALGRPVLPDPQGHRLAGWRPDSGPAKKWQVGRCGRAREASALQPAPSTKFAFALQFYSRLLFARIRRGASGQAAAE